MFTVITMTTSMARKVTPAVTTAAVSIAAIDDVMWAMQQIMFKGLDRRLAEFLLAEAERTGSDTIRMTHEQIAQHISSAREAVARMLKSFLEDGLVDLKRGAITLRDKNRLNRLK